MVHKDEAGIVNHLYGSDVAHEFTPFRRQPLECTTMVQDSLEVLPVTSCVPVKYILLHPLLDAISSLKHQVEWSALQ